MIVVPCLLSSCERVDREELELLKKDDPSFQRVVGLKGEIQAQIAALKAELAQYKAVLDKRLAELKASYDGEAARLGGEIRLLQGKIDSSRSLYKGELSELEADLARKKKEYDELTKALGDLNDVLAKQGTIAFSADQSRQLADKRSGLEQKIADLSLAIQKLQSEITLKRKKLKYI